MMIITECCASWTCIFLGGSCCCFSKMGTKTSRLTIISGSFLLGFVGLPNLTLWSFGWQGWHICTRPLCPGPAWIKEGPLEDKKPAMKSFKPPSQPQHQRKRKNRCLHLFGLKNLDRSHKTSFFSILWFLISFFWIFNHFCNLDVCFCFFVSIDSSAEDVYMLSVFAKDL